MNRRAPSRCGLRAKARVHPTALSPLMANVLLLWWSWTAGCANDPGETGKQQPSSPIVFLRTGSVRLEHHTQWDASHGRRLLSDAAPMTDSRWGILRDARQVLLSLQAPILATTLKEIDEALRGHGGMVSSYLPEDSVLVVGRQKALQQITAFGNILGVGEFLPEHKVAPEWITVLEGLSAGGVGMAGLTDWTFEARSNGTWPGRSHLLGAVQTDQGQDGSVRFLVEVSFPSAMFNNKSRSPRQFEPRRMRGQEKGRDDPAGAAVRDWPHLLAEACGSSHRRLSLSADGTHQLVAWVPAEHLRQALAWLSTQPAVHWVAPRAQARLSNYFETSILQGAAARGPAADGHPLWAAGLDGRGQIIGCGDSGIDVGSCYFHDPKVPFVPEMTTDAGGKRYFSSDTHRKIRYYRLFADGLDVNGHGTHVAASIAGSTDQEKWSNDNGMAPGAKLAFTDLGKGSGTSRGGIGVPGNLRKDYFPYAWNYGARIFSESWGSDSSTYDGLARGVDEMAWENPEFLAVIAAGNFGGLEADANINSPATCKNAITVGATLTVDQPGMAQVPVERDGDVFRVLVHGGLPGDGAANDVYNIQLAYFGPAFGQSLLGRPLGLAMTQPIDACSAIINADEVRGKVALVERGECRFVEKVLNAQRAGAIAVLVANNGPSGSFKMTFPESSGSLLSMIVIPIASMPRNAARPMLRALESGRTLSIRLGTQHLPDDRFSNLAPFSSIGPTPDGRIKPDVVAPGITVSAGLAASPGQCSRSVLHGTSMATPLVGGGAAIVRQYFMEGRYPTGTADRNHSSTPSGALVKAVIIAGAAQMSGTTPSDNPHLNGVPLEPPPSIRQGFGRVNLGISLPLEGAKWRLQAVDQAPIETGQAHRYCIDASGGWLKVVLVWHDPPSDVAAAKNLVNNLDLSVQSAGLGGSKVLGNGDRDDTNNAEMLYFPAVPYGTVAITVEGTQVPQGPQPYSMVVLGQFTGNLQGPYNPVQNDSGSDACVVVMAKVFIGPPELSSNRHPGFTFGNSASRQADEPEFECRLASQQANSAVSPQLHDWQPCRSPANYRNLADGAYEFAVRGAGEEMVDVRPFVVDTSPPVLSMLESPEHVAVTPDALFRFTAADESSVEFECQLQLADGAQEVPGSLSGISNPGHWESCSSPVKVGGVGAGVWRFRVRGADEAGNTGNEVLTEWRYDPDTSKVYTRITSGPEGPIRDKQPVFSFELSRAYPPAVAGAGFECTHESFGGSQAIAGSWQKCTSPHRLSELADGEHAFSVRSRTSGGRASLEMADRRLFAVRGSSAGFAGVLWLEGGHHPERQLLQVDTMPGQLEITAHPPSLQTGPVATFEFQSSKQGMQTRCTLIALGESRDGLRAIPCTSPQAYLNLGDGRYKFVLEGEDKSGNTARQQEYTWTIDSTAPYLLSLSVTSGASLQQPAVEDKTAEDSAAEEYKKVSTTYNLLGFNWQIGDGPEGTGVESVFCVMDPIEVDESQSPPAGVLDSGAVTSHRGGAALCNAPRAYWLAEGNYTFSLTAVDRAQNSANLLAMTVVVDKQPPASVTRFGPDLDTPVASSVLLSVEALDSGVAPSGVKDLWGLLKRIEQTDIERERSSLVDSVALPLEQGGGAVDAAIRAEGGAAENLQVSIRGFQAISLGSWIKLPYLEQRLLPLIFDGLPSGIYAFRTMAIDWAGNIGPQASPVLFKVDSSLPVPVFDEDSLGNLEAPQGSALSDALPTIKVAIPISCVVVLMIAAAFGIWQHRRRVNRLRRKRFLAMRDDHRRDREAVPRAGPVGQRKQVASVATDAAHHRPAVLETRDVDIGPWRLQLDWAPLSRMNSVDTDDVVVGSSSNSMGDLLKMRRGPGVL